MQDFEDQGPVVYVSPRGEAVIGEGVQARVDRVVGVSRPVSRRRGEVYAAFEAAACSAVLDRASAPPDCGEAIPCAPARGVMMSFMPRAVVRTEAGSYRSVNAGYLGRRAVRVLDAFDRMTGDAIKAHGKARGNAWFAPPFTVGQVEIGREYAALVERVNGSGLRCASLEAAGRGDGSGGGVQDAVFRDIERLRLLRYRIGAGLAKEVRRIRPGGDKRRAIRARDLVDQVCVEGLSIEGVLKRHGWGVDQKSRAGLRTALCGALDRMRGFDLARPTKY